MPDTGFETSLIEAAYRLMIVLLFLVLAAVVAGIMTLPVFYGVLGYKVVWFRAMDSSGRGGLRGLLIKVCRVFPPAFSIVATILSFGYFGVFDWPARMVGVVKGNKPGPAQAAVKDVFDRLTRFVGEQTSQALDQDVAINWARCPDKAKELVELWNKEQEQKPVPFEKIFPEQPAGPPSSIGPQTAPPVVIDKVEEFIADAKSGKLYDGTSTQEVDKETLLLADRYFDRAVKESRAKQDRRVLELRAMLLYILLILGPIPLAIFLAAFILGRRGVVLGMRNLIRSLLRTSLTYFAVFVLVFLLCCVWSILAFLNQIMTKNDSNLKGIITEKYQIPSMMKPSHLNDVKTLIARLPEGQRPDNVEDNIMTWAFVGGSLDPTKMTPQNQIFFFATEPQKLLKMMPGLDELSGEEKSQVERAVEQMSRDPKAVVIGAEKLRQMGKRVGDRMKVTSFNYKGLEFDFVVVAEFPSGSRWDNSAVMNRKYLDDALDTYKGEKGTPHPLADKCMNLIWVRLPNEKAFETLSKWIGDTGGGGQGEGAPIKFSPAIKMEIESSAYGKFLSPYKTLFWFMKWPLSIGLLAITTLVASLVIGIGVRERKAEIAVLKVLGFRPWMVLGLVLGEALLVGTLSGFMATATAYSAVNASGGISLGIAFFSRFFVPEDALWWGPLIGGITSLIGAILPSMTAYRIRASQVFSRVT